MDNGTTETAPAAAEAEEKPVVPGLHVLSDGRSITMRAAKGRDLMKAAQVAGSAGQVAIFMALGAELVRVQTEEASKQRILYEEVLDMPLSDALLIIGAAAGNVDTPALATFFG